MSDSRKWFITGLVSCMACVPALAGADGQPVFNIPHLDDIAIDGKADDWGQGGFAVRCMGNPRGKLARPEEFYPAFRLGWNDQGLLVLVQVRDKFIKEHPDASQLAANDAVVLAVSSPAGPSFYTLTIGPGADGQAQPRHEFTDHRRGADAPPLNAAIAASRTADGYVIEALLPWANLGVQPKDGLELGFQIVVWDIDKQGRRDRGWWYPNTPDDAGQMHRIRLWDKAGPPVRLAAGTARFEKFYKVTSTLFAPADLAGKEVAVISNGKAVQKIALQKADGCASGELSLPISRIGDDALWLELQIDDQPAGYVMLPASPRKAKAQTMITERIVFEPYCFAGEKFPSCDFDQPALVENLIGPYTIKTTYYDADFNIVTKAGKLGRYGVMIDIIPAGGPPLRRLRTICRTEVDPVEAWSRDLPIPTGYIEALKVDRQMVLADHRPAAEFFKYSLLDALQTNKDIGMLLAHMYENRGKDVKAFDYAGDAEAANEQWWVTFKRKFYGLDKQFGKPIEWPSKLDGPPAPVVREGTLAQAGFKPDAIRKIDALCQAWAADSDEAFAVCIVRNGVIVLHKAYGTRDGEPMTVDTPSWMASITKLFGTTLMMMLVDRGLVDLDDRVDLYVPSFRGIDVATPLTIRHLYTHTAGLWGDGWDSGMVDFEEALAGYYPYLEVGKRYRYNGADVALGGRVIEMIGGEALPMAYKNHLFGPLGCAHTSARGADGDAYSTPLDIARIGQMILNGGSYGDMLFFGRRTAARRMPPDKPYQVPGGAYVSEGLAMDYAEIEGLGQKVWVHGAASGADLLIDPQTKLIVVMTRNATGKNFQKYHGEFLKLVGQGIERTGEATTAPAATSTTENAQR